MFSEINNKNKLFIYILMILTLGILLRAVFFSGYVSGDDRAYIARAYNYFQGDWGAPYSHWGARTAIVLSTTLSYKLFGVNIYSTALFPFIFSISSIILAYLFASYLFDKKTGVMAAFLLAIFPMDVFFASQLFPYSFLTLFSCLSLYLFCKGNDENRPVLLLLSGISLGIAYLCRITALYCLIFFVLYLFWKKEYNKKIFFVVVGLTIVVCLESLFYFWQSGDFLLRLHILTNKVSVINKTIPTKKNVDAAWILEPLIRPFFEQEFGLFFPFFLFSIFFSVFCRGNNKTKSLLIWIIPIFIYLSYGTTSPLYYHPLRRLPRYQSVLIIPWIVLLSYSILKLNKQWKKNIIIGVLFISSITALSVDNSRHIKTPLIKMTNFLNTKLSADNILIDRPLFFDYQFLNGFKKNNKIGLLVQPNDESDTLNRIKIVYPDVKKINYINNVDYDAWIVLSPKYYDKETISYLFDCCLKETIYESNTFYHALLKLPPVRFLLKYVRDEKRYNALIANDQKKLNIFYLKK